MIAPTVDLKDQEEIEQLRQNLVNLTSELDETRRAWQQYQQAQVALLRQEMDQCLSLDYDRSIDEIGRQIVDQIMRERDEFNEKYRDLQREHDRAVEGE